MAIEIKTAKLPAAHAGAIREKVDMHTLSRFIGEAFHELTSVLVKQDLKPLGPPFVRYFAFTPERIDVEAVLCADAPVRASGRVKPLELESAEAAIVKHVGPYEQIGPAYDALQEWLHAHGKHATEAPREVYVTSPAEQPDPSRWVTLVEQPMASTV